MYAIAFDLDTGALDEKYALTNPNAYAQIRAILEANGFENKQGSVYFANTDVDAVHVVLTVQQIAKTYPWFSECVRDIRMLRIEANNDLRPAIDAAVGVGDQIELSL